MDREHNIAYIDGQNLYLGTAKLKSDPWKISLKKLRIYLKDRYQATTCYYFLGYVNQEYQDLYTEIQEAGFILQFREHNSAMQGKKKGNVDSDIVFHIMKKLYKEDVFDRIILLSGDGDYKMLVDFLIRERRFKKILLPNKKFASSLYKNLGSEFYDYLDNPGIKRKIKV
jgi:uncharacterized LabA/DUF88 family protein